MQKRNPNIVLVVRTASFVLDTVDEVINYILSIPRILHFIAAVTTYLNYCKDDEIFR